MRKSYNSGDVIISRAGTVGKMGVVRSKYSESLISTNLIRVRFGENLLPEYFVSLMSYCKNRLSIPKELEKNNTPDSKVDPIVKTIFSK